MNLERKIWLVLLVLLGLTAGKAENVNAIPESVDEPAGSYERFVQQMGTVENLTDCISRMDELVDAAETPIEAADNTPVGAAAETKLGLHMEFSIATAHNAVVYYFVVSRNGRAFTFPDAGKFISLFGDRIGLPHPIIMSEGGKHNFYGQWMVEPAKLKSLKKKMAKVRTQNRTEKDPVKAFNLAVIRELDARDMVQRKQEKKDSD